MSITTLQLDQLVDPFEARVVYTRDSAGSITDARFDLSGLPRLDPILVGKPVAEVPDIVKRLCSLCPVAHHLAGVRALESLFGIAEVPPAAQATRSLLMHGAIIESVALKFLAVDRDLALRARSFGKLVLKAAGSPGHFPDVAVVGGVKAPADVSLLGSEPEQLLELLAAIPAAAPIADAFAGENVALADASGELDPLGHWVRVGESKFPVASWPEFVSETAPGEPACRPVITLVEPTPYRVGPIAQSRLFGTATSPLEAQKELLMRSLRAVSTLTLQPLLFDGPLSVMGQYRAGVGIGAVDGPRGLLVHTYEADADGILTRCQILTPTAQNEWWLANMLRASLREDAGVEGAIRAADPCLPVSSAPPGAMDVRIEEA